MQLLFSKPGHRLNGRPKRKACRDVCGDLGRRGLLQHCLCIVDVECLTTYVCDVIACCGTPPVGQSSRTPRANWHMMRLLR
eukprot:3453620-Pyramimonas_sp.AAC.1